MDNENKEISIRPYSIDEYIGQINLVNKLKIYIKAAKIRDEPLDHILFYGPSGLGKTTLAYLIANEMKANIKIINGLTIEKSGDLAVCFSSLEAGDILFIDEIHRIPKIIMEGLYSAMEDFTFQIIINHNDAPKSISIDLPPFTLIGSTTRIGDLPYPLRNRFGITEKLSYYTNNELSEIIKRTAKVFELQIEEKAALEIAKRSRGTPRIANNIFKRIRDFVTPNDSSIITYKDVLNGLNVLEIDKIGLNIIDLNYLKTLILYFHGGPVGLETLANTIGEEATNLEDVVEPYLLQIGMIERTLRGRRALEKAYLYLNIDSKK